MKHSANYMDAQLRALLAKQPEAKPQIRGEMKAGDKPNANKPKQDRAAMFAKRDTNKDGKLTREEFLDGQPDPAEAPKRFTLFDTDKDGVLSRDEFITGGKEQEVKSRVCPPVTSDRACAYHNRISVPKS